jgi:lysophospholipase-2
VFPTGRLRYTTVLERDSHAWFDFHSFSDRRQNEEGQREGLRESVVYLGNLVADQLGTLRRKRIEEEEKARSLMGMRSREKKNNRLVIGGFSQGCAASMILLLSGELARYGVRTDEIRFWGMSGWLPFREHLLFAVTDPAFANSPFLSRHWEPADRLNPQNQLTKSILVISAVRTILCLPPLPPDTIENWNLSEIPIFLGHGQGDMKMRPELGQQMLEFLVKVYAGPNGNGNVRWKVYPGLGHTLSEGVVRDLMAWVRE